MHWALKRQENSKSILSLARFNVKSCIKTSFRTSICTQPHEAVPFLLVVSLSQLHSKHKNRQPRQWTLWAMMQATKIVESSFWAASKLRYANCWGHSHSNKKLNVQLSPKRFFFYFRVDWFTNILLNFKYPVKTKKSQDFFPFKIHIIIQNTN